MPDKRDIHQAKSKRNHKTPTGKGSRSAATATAGTMASPSAAETDLDAKGGNQSRKHR